MRRSLTQALRIGIVVLAMAVVATAGIALAQTDPAPGDEPATVAAQDGNEEATPRREGRRWPHLRLRGLVECVGASGDVISAGLRAGKTIAEIAAEHDTTTEEVVACALGKLGTALEEAVDNGRITPAHRDTILQRTAERLETFLNTTHPVRTTAERHRHQAQQRREQRQDHLSAVLGEPFEQIQAKLRDGATLAELGAATGLEVEELVAQLLAPFVAKVRARAEDGTITEEQATRLIERATARVTRAVTTPHDERRARPGAPRHHRAGANHIAQVLGKTPAELRAARAEGARLPELVAQAGLTAGEFIEEATAPLAERVRKAQAEGKGYADRLADALARARQRLRERLEGADG